MYSSRSALSIKGIVGLILLLSVFLATGVSAQKLRVDDVPSHAYDGVKHINGERYYMFNPVVGSFTDRTLIQISPDLKELSRNVLAFGRLVAMEAAAGNGKNFLYYISSDKTGHLYLYDEAGQELQHKELVAANNLVNKATLYPWGDKGYYIVRPDKNKKKGFRVALYDNSLEMLWEKIYIPEKGKYVLEESAASSTRVNVLYKFDKETKMLSLNATDGSEAYHVVADQDKMKLYPEKMAMGENNVVAVHGKYSPEAAVKSSDERFNFYFQVLGVDGSQTSFDAAVWPEETLDQIRSVSTINAYSEGSDAQFYVHSMVATANGFRLLGETVKHITPDHDDYPLVGGGTKVGAADMPNIYAKPGFFFAMDLVQMDFDQAGKRTGITRISKPVKRTKTLGQINSSNLFGNADYLLGYGRLGYQFTTTAADGKIAHVTLGNNHNQMYAGFLREGEKMDNVFTRDYLEVPMVKEGGNQGEKSSLTFKKESLGSETLKTNGFLNHLAILPGKDGNYVMCQYEDRTVHFEKRTMEPAPDPKRIKGVINRDFRTGTLSNGGTYSFYFSESGYNGNMNYVLHCSDANQKMLGSHVLEVTERGRFLGVFTNANGLMIAFHNPEAGQYHLISVGSNGQLLGQKAYQPALPEGTKHANGAQIESDGKDGFYLLMRASHGETNIAGYLLAHFQKDLAVSWEKPNQMKKGESLNISLQATNEAGVALQRDLRWMENDEGFYERALIVYAPSGEQTVSYKIPATNPLYNPVVLGPENGSSMYVAGVKFVEEEKVMQAKGLFFDVLTPGKEGEPAFLAWEKIAGMIESQNWLESFQQGILRFNLLDLTSHPKGVALVTEIVRYPQPNGGSKYNAGGGVLSDFAVMVFDGNAELQDMYLVPRVALNLAGLQATHLFSYHTTLGEGADREILYTGIGSDLEPYTYATSISKQTERSYKVAHARLKQEPKPNVEEKDNSEHWALEMQDKLDLFSKKMDKLLSEAPPAPSYRHDGNTDQVFGNPGTLFVYRFDKKANKLIWVKRQLK